MRDKKQVIYYHNELEDEFSTANIKAKKIDESYNYDDSLSRKLSHLLCYIVLARPIAWVFLKIKYFHKIVNRNILKEAKGKGYFMYGNHTHAIADALIPSMVNFPVDTYVIVHPNNVSMPVLGKVTPSLGAIPLPDNAKATRNFIKKIRESIEEKRCVMIYPEAHIWPYYTKIRPFAETSFRYPVKLDAPVYCFTNTYQKRLLSKKPRIVTYVDGPFFADPDLSEPEQKKKLRDQVYQTMKERSKNNTVQVIEYVKRD